MDVFSTIREVWAHGEYIKLLRSLHSGAIWDLPTQTVERYVKQGKKAEFQIWTTKQRRGWMDQGMDLRVDLDGPASIRWTAEGKPTQTLSTRDTGFQLHSATLPVSAVEGGGKIEVEIAPEKADGEFKADFFRVHVRGEGR